MDPRIPPLVCMVKHWTKTRGLVGAQENHLSSYAPTFHNRHIPFLDLTENLAELYMELYLYLLLVGYHSLEEKQKYGVVYGVVLVLIIRSEFRISP